MGADSSVDHENFEELTGKFTRKLNYYTGVVYEWNLPVGYSCPFADECLVRVDPESGRFSNHSGAYKCYAASHERFPSVRSRRWQNYAYVRAGGVPEVPAACNACRIHMAGDFFSQTYFDTWLGVCEANPRKEFWAYTKSLLYWIRRIKDIPKNLVLTASYGGRSDDLIEKHNLKNVIVYGSADEVPADRPIDVNDDWARKPDVNFALLDNVKNSKKEIHQIGKSEVSK